MYTHVGMQAQGEQHQGNIRDQTDVRIIQHTSAACRASRHSLLAHLPMAQLLMRIDDVDASMLREVATTGQNSVKETYTAEEKIYSSSAVHIAKDRTQSSTFSLSSIYSNTMRICQAMYAIFSFTGILTGILMLLPWWASELLYALLVIMALPILWTATIIGAIFLYEYNSFVYVYIIGILSFYVLIQYICIYPARQRIRKKLIHLQEQGALSKDRSMQES